MESLRWSKAEPHRSWRTGLSHPSQKHRQDKSCSHWEMSRRNRTSSNENFDVWDIYCVQCWFAAFILAGLHWTPGGTWAKKKHRGELEGLYEDNKLAAEQLTTLLDEECEERCQNDFLQAPHAHVLAHTGNNRLHLGDRRARLPRCSPFVLSVCCVSPFFEKRSSIALCCLHDHFNWTLKMTTGTKPQLLWWAVQWLSPFLLLGFMFFLPQTKNMLLRLGKPPKFSFVWVRNASRPFSSFLFMSSNRNWTSNIMEHVLARCISQLGHLCSLNTTVFTCRYVCPFLSFCIVHSFT